MNKYRVTDITIGYLEAESFCVPILAPNYLPYLDKQSPGQLRL